jgi:hypothetical protein
MKKFHVLMSWMFPPKPGRGVLIGGKQKKISFSLKAQPLEMVF